MNKMKRILKKEGKIEEYKTKYKSKCGLWRQKTG